MHQKELRHSENNHECEQSKCKDIVGKTAEYSPKETNQFILETIIYFHSILKLQTCFLLYLFSKYAAAMHL